MSLSFSSECLRARAAFGSEAGRNFAVEDADLITDDLLRQIIQSAQELQGYCRAKNGNTPCPAGCQVARLAAADLVTLGSLFLNS